MRTLLTLLRHPDRHISADGGRGLTLRRFIAPWVLDGLINRDAFETYVQKVLVPELRPGDIVVMDNLSSHKGPRVREMIEVAGTDLPYLPPYSPHFNPSRTPSPSSRRCSERSCPIAWCS